jgi:hypothetical protein
MVRCRVRDFMALLRSEVKWRDGPASSPLEPLAGQGLCSPFVAGGETVGGTAAPGGKALEIT